MRSSRAADDAPPPPTPTVIAHRLLYTAPVVVVAVYGASWIAANPADGRVATHTLWQSLTLAEVTVAVLLRARKPVGALAGIVAAYLIFQLPWLTLPPLLFTLLTVAAIRDRRTTAVAAGVVAAAIVAAHYLQRNPAGFATTGLPLLAAGILATTGMHARVYLNGTGGTSRPWILIGALVTGSAAGAHQPHVVRTDRGLPQP